MGADADHELEEASGSGERGPRQTTYKGYLLALLMLILTFNWVDRIALGVVLQNIKTDLALTDTQLGLLTGIAFALFYSLMGIPLARWADRGNRVLIISLTSALWSCMVALCGAATSFTQLLLIRIGVGVGEAGCNPPAYSLIADYFSREERPRANARYLLGIPLALGIGYFAAGWLNELVGWRVTFLILGAPGLALAALAAVTLKEPRRIGKASGARGLPSQQVSSTVSGDTSPDVAPRFVETCVRLWANITFRHLLISYAVWNLFGTAIVQWMPAFFIRSHGLQTGELGTWLAVIFGGSAAIGIYLGAELATRYAKGNERLQLNACAVAVVFFSTINTYVFLAPDHYGAFAALALAALGINLVQGPLVATMQTLVAPRMRAMAFALVGLFSNLIGMGLGPLAAGALSDVLQPWLGEESLRYALTLLLPGHFWMAWHIWHAGRTVERDLKTAQSGDHTASLGGEVELHQERGI